MKILSGPLSMFGAKAEIAALEKGLAVDVEMVPFAIATGYAPRHPDVLRVNPKEEVPVLLDGDFSLYDSTQLLEYFEDIAPEPALWPADSKQRARARLLELEVDEVFFLGSVVLQMPRRAAVAGPERVQEAVEAIHRYYDAMEAQLDTREFLMGTLSFADIGFYMACFFASFLGQPWRASHPNLDAWSARMTQRPSVQRVAGTMASYLDSNGIPKPGIAPGRAAGGA